MSQTQSSVMAVSPSQERPPHTRAKSGSLSVFSTKSDKSDKIKASKIKVDLHETKEDKMKSKFNQKTTANPNQAIREDQPMVRAQGEMTTLRPLRGAQYKDWQGNPITDPDSSNPARPRLERPLDTIRSFEAAIDGGHRQRVKMQRSESAGDLFTGNSSRRSSMHGSDFNVNPRSTLALSSPYGQPPLRRTSYQRDAYDQYNKAGPPSSYNKRGGMGQRVVTAPAFTRQQFSQEYNQHPQQQLLLSHHGYYDSIDTTAESSGTSEPWTNNTDPSSENSSIDRIHAARFSTDGDAYASSTPYGRTSPNKVPTPGPIVEETYHPSGFQGQYNQQSAPYSGPPVPMKEYQQQQHMAPRGSSYGPRAPPPPTHQPGPQYPSQRQPARNVIPLGQPSANVQQQQPQQYRQNSYYDQPRPNAPRMKQVPEKPEKRKSWLKRTFSRN